VKKETGKKCSSCTIQGYSPEICKLHLQHRKKCVADCDEHRSSWKKWRNSALVGAGVGAGGAVACMAVIPVIGIKAILGHMIATKITFGAASLGAGSNMALNAGRRKSEGAKRKGKRKSSLLVERIKARRNRYDGRDNECI